MTDPELNSHNRDNKTNSQETQYIDIIQDTETHWILILETARTKSN